MPRRRTTTNPPATSGQARRRKITSAATMLPLALGLAGNVNTSHPAAGAHAGTSGGPGAPISISCSLPFTPIQRHHAIDDACPATGNSKLDTPQAAQNEAKNNFCAANTPNAPVNIDFDVLHQLQQEAAKVTTFGSDGSLPQDRSVLRKLSSNAGSIGEGTVVRIVAFVISAHPSNVGSGESVNCKRKDAESNDIHIVLGKNSNQDEECSSVTAEMSPHFRPDTWTPDNMNHNNARLFRFTGHLFFDASHKPCSGSTGPNPKRSSLWEIHPVYAVEICGDTRNDCKVDSDQNWIALPDFVGPGEQEGENSNSESRVERPGRFRMAEPLRGPS
ncbi:MAG: hypothetical protein WB562_10705 [Candidatus Sulfotelmatobacter sp.]